VLRNDQPLPLKDALMETVWFHIYDIYHYGQVGPVNSQVLLIELNLRPGALASTPSEIKKLKQQLANELSQGTVHKPTTPGRRLRLFGRLNKFGRDPSHVVDCVRDLVNVKPKALANNWGQNMLNP